MLGSMGRRPWSPWRVPGGRRRDPCVLGPRLAQHSAEHVVGGFKHLWTL